MVCIDLRGRNCVGFVGLLLPHKQSSFHCPRSHVNSRSPLGFILEKEVKNSSTARSHKSFIGILETPLGSVIILSFENMPVSPVDTSEPTPGALWNPHESYAGVELSIYIGQYYDEETALSYLNARYYDAARGQFTSQDPVFWGDPKSQDLTNPQSFNSYSYALNNPIVNKDTNGTFSIRAALQAIISQLQSLMGSLNSLFGGGGNSTSGSSDSKKQNQGGGGAGTNPSINVPGPWFSQITNNTTCYDACAEIAGYKGLREKAIDVASYQNNIYGNGNLIISSKAKEGIDAINNHLLSSQRITVGVHQEGSNQNNFNVATNHFVVINGMGVDSKGAYYTFVDPGTSRREAGESPQNKLYVGQDYSLRGTTVYSGKTYTVTEVRPK